MRRPGELTAKEAAFELECDYRTVTRWARALRDGKHTPLKTARTDATGHIFVQEDEVRALRESRGADLL